MSVNNHHTNALSHQVTEQLVVACVTWDSNDNFSLNFSVLHIQKQYQGRVYQPSLFNLRDFYVRCKLIKQATKVFLMLNYFNFKSKQIWLLYTEHVSILLGKFEKDKTFIWLPVVNWYLCTKRSKKIKWMRGLAQYNWEVQKVKRPSINEGCLESPFSHSRLLPYTKAGN